MRGPDRQQFQMISYVSLEKRVPAEHPLRTLWALSDAVLQDLSPLFDQLYARTGRPSIAPEKLLRAILLQVLYSIRSEALLMEQLDYNLLFRWFVGLDVDDPVWDATVFSKNRQRLLDGEVATAFFVRVRALAEEHGLLSDEHFTVDGTVVQAWAGQKSFQRRDRDTPPPSDPEGGGVNFRGEKRSNQTHASTTDPQARLYRKSHSAEAKLCYLGHVLMENRHGLVVETEVTEATGTGERDAGAAMPVRRGRRGATLGADKAYDTRGFVAAVRAAGGVPHVAQNTRGVSAEGNCPENAELICPPNPSTGTDPRATKQVERSHAQEGGLDGDSSAGGARCLLEGHRGRIGRGPADGAAGVGAGRAAEWAAAGRPAQQAGPV